MKRFELYRDKIYDNKVKLITNIDGKIIYNMFHSGFDDFVWLHDSIESELSDSEKVSPDQIDDNYLHLYIKKIFTITEMKWIG